MLRADAGGRTIAGCISNNRYFGKLSELFSDISNSSYIYSKNNNIRSDIKCDSCEKVTLLPLSGSVSLSDRHFAGSDYRASDAECTFARPAPSATKPPVLFEESGNDSGLGNILAPTIQAASLTAWSVCWLRVKSFAQALVCSFAGFCSYRSCNINIGNFGLTALQPVRVMSQSEREWGVGRDTFGVSLYRRDGWSHSATRRRHG
jgi:hypothetical protein